MQPLIPDIEENLALPASMAEAMPDLSPQEELAMRARTIKFISDLSNQPIILDQSDCASAQELAVEMTNNPKKRLDLARYPNETVAFLAGLVAESNHMIVDDLSELKLFVLNGLVKEYAASDDPKLRTQILSKIGEVDGVDAFKKRTETTHVIKPLEEVEKELLTVLEGIEFTVLGESDAKSDA